MHRPTDDTRKKVSEWAKYGVSQDHMAVALGISDNTLRKHYRDELDASDGEWCASFEVSIKRKVLKDDCPPALVIFAARAKLGWREQTALDPDKKSRGEMTDAELSARIATRARERRRESGPAGDPEKKSGTG